MPVEIERKFLVIPDRLPKLGKGDPLIQGYLSVKPVVRIRVGVRRAWLTVKGPGTIERDEFEYEVPLEDGDHMLELCEGRTVAKSRFTVVHQTQTWVIDRFDNNGPNHLSGLWLAEIELTNAKEPLMMPPWAGREVTHNSDYANVSLATKGMPKKVMPNDPDPIDREALARLRGVLEAHPPCRPEEGSYAELDEGVVTIRGPSGYLIMRMPVEVYEDLRNYKG